MTGRAVSYVVCACAFAGCASPPTRAAARVEQRPLTSSTTIASSPPIPADAPDAGDVDAEARDADAARDAAGGGDIARNPAGTCPPEMAYVEGSACSAVHQECAEWIEAPSIAKDGRCKRFASPSTCVGTRSTMRFCIDRDEYTAGADPKPVTTVSWTDAQAICTKAGKRLCRESEWNFACEGEEMLPYPTGYERPVGKCNFDQHKLTDAWGKIIDFRRASAELTECASPFGVRNMVGNVDEWTYRDVMNGEWRSALKGGWWLAGRNRCRPATTAHDEHYRDFQTGFRCCADVK